MKIKHVEPYEPLRAKEYPPINDQLDAIFKIAKELKNQGIYLPEEALNWIDQCQSVKDKYPKNSE